MFLHNEVINNYYIISVSVKKFFLQFCPKNQFINLVFSILIKKQEISNSFLSHGSLAIRGELNKKLRNSASEGEILH